MIRFENGKWVSHRTEAELLAELQSEMDRLSPEEKIALQAMLSEMQGNGQGGGRKLIQSLEDLEYERPPVDPLTFIEDPYYLGAVGNGMFPKLKDDFIRLFTGSYEEAVLTGSIGFGKTYFAIMAINYILYQLTCLRSPAETFGLAAGSQLHIVNLSARKDTAQRVVFEGISDKLVLSPYFREIGMERRKEELRFPKNIVVLGGESTDTSVLGLSVVSALMDESNFLRGQISRANQARWHHYSKAESLYTAIKTRMQSRFLKMGHLPGLLIIVSSRQVPDDFTEVKIRQSQDDPKVFVMDYCLTGDTKIPLLDGSTPTIEELASRSSGSDDPFWVYSLDPKSGLVVPGRAHHPRLTARQERVLKITLDNGQLVRATARHPFMMRDGTYRRASELKPDDSLMPLYRQIDDWGYEEVAHPGWNGRWQKTHHAAYRAVHGSWPKRGSDGLPSVIHHVDHRKRNNSPDNLELKTWTDHRLHHQQTMDRLLAHVKTPEHRAFASKHMTKLHQDPEFAARRNARGAGSFKSLWANPEWKQRASEAAGKRLTEFHKTPKGRLRQTERNFKRWEKTRKLRLADVLNVAQTGLSVTELAKMRDCSPGAVCQVLRRAGYPKYSELKRTAEYSRANHKVVSIEDGGLADVYDLSVDEYQNFGLEAGVFVHNSLWDVKTENYSKEMFKVYVGAGGQKPRIMEPGETVPLKEGERIVEVPIDFRKRFEDDLPGSLRDIAGVSVITITTFLQSRDKLFSVIDKERPHPFSQEEWDPSTEGRFLWDKLTRLNERGELEPRHHPQAIRYVAIDPSLSGDATGFAVGCVCGFKKVVRKDENGKEFEEEAPQIWVDFILRIVPPRGGEIFLGDVRNLIYQLSERGFPISRVSLDSFQSADSVQQLRLKGYTAEIVSVDSSIQPYQLLKGTIYEGRLSVYEYPKLIEELKNLEMNWEKKKVDHNVSGSKDCADAVCALVWSLSQKFSKRGANVYGAPPMLGISEHDKEETYVPADSKHKKAGEIIWGDDEEEEKQWREQEKEEKEAISQDGDLPPFLMG